MERNDLERAAGHGARLVCAAAGLGASLLLAPARFALRAVLPSPADDSGTDPDGTASEIDVDAPWEGYDAMNVAEVVRRLRGADPALRAVVRRYEERHKNRSGVLARTGPGAAPGRGRR